MLPQTDYYYYFGIDPSTLPFMHVLITVAGVVVIAVAAMRILGGRIKKIGKIEFGGGDSPHARADFGAEIQAVDDDLRMQIVETIKRRKTRLNNLFKKKTSCAIARIALYNTIPAPLFVSANKNHFVYELLPSNRERYVNNLLATIKAEYDSVYLAMQDGKCEGGGNILPKWEDGLEDEIRDFLNEWVVDVVDETVKSCRRKADVYRSCEAVFAGDHAQLNVLKNRIMQSENDIQLLKGLR
ncbi:MAG: hypothetical protein FWG66_01220 [Spirochaetes bacterium]|nr:hypothetical protein [Spirochaetota bacterium]